MKIFTGIVLLVLVCACSDTENEIKDLRETESKVEHESSGYEKKSKEPDSIVSKVDQIQENVPTSDWSYEVVLISENNWGYQLFQKGTMIINQTSIPSVQGVDGFDSQEKADRTAKHIINKLENGIFPPTVNKEELDSLDALRD
jgi:hypothetical protein